MGESPVYRILWLVVTVIGIASGWAAGSVFSAGPLVAPATAVFIVGGTLSLAATLFVAVRSRQAPEPIPSEQACTLDDTWQVVAFDSVGRAVDVNVLRDAFGDTEVSMADLIVVARRTALPVPDPDNPAVFVRPDYFEDEDIAEQFDVELLPLRMVRVTIENAGWTAHQLNTSESAAVQAPPHSIGL